MDVNRLVASSESAIIVHVGPIKIDVPQSIGHYAGLGAAVAFGILVPPAAMFIAAVPLFKISAKRDSSAGPVHRSAVAGRR